MLGVVFLWYSLVLADLAKALQDQSRFCLRNFGLYAQSPPSEGCKVTFTCEEIARSISPKSQVFYPNSSEFDFDISHWANSSSQVPVCSVEPGTPDDVATILQHISRARVPFAVKGGGHTTNPGFSSTSGVHISMTRFNDIVIREDRRTIEVGAGLTWTDVYRYIVPMGLNVVGGRLDGVGVAGLTLGGGYSWKTNEYGLTIDSVTEFHLVLPNGTQTVVTETDKDLWFALKGGLNNYGIVTKFTLKLYPQTDVWGALLNFEGDLVDLAEDSFAKFLSEPHDRKASQTGQILYINGSVSFAFWLFYDGPEPPTGLYDELLNLAPTTTTIFRGKFTDFVSAQVLPTYDRVHVHGVPMLHYTKPVLKSFVNETKFWGEKLSQYDDSMLVASTVEPLEPGFLTHGSPSAYPPDRSLAILPSNIYFAWTKASADEFIAEAMRLLAASLVEAGIQDGQDLKNAAPYLNYALFGTPLELMYGEHLERLRDIKKKYDPEDVMGLAGGWKF